MRIRKAVVTAAGLGTRFLPATKAQPKETLPLVDKPLIQHIVEEAVDSGIELVIIVTALGKHVIEDHFDRSADLELALQQRGDQDRLDMVRRISELAAISYVRQKEQLGLGHAILVAKDLVGNEAFAVFLPDDIIDAEVPAMKQMLEVFNRYKCSVVAVQAVPEDRVDSYGVVRCHSVEERIYRIEDLVEKPAIDEAPSNLAIVGRYILTPEIFEALEHTPPGRNNEIQLTDGIRQLLKHQAIYAYEFDGKWHDTGTPLGLLKASVEMALKREDIGPEFRRYLEQLSLEYNIALGGGSTSMRGSATEKKG